MSSHHNRTVPLTLLTLSFFRIFMVNLPSPLMTSLQQRPRLRKLRRPHHSMTIRLRKLCRPPHHTMTLHHHLSLILHQMVHLHSLSSINVEFSPSLHHLLKNLVHGFAGLLPTLPTTTIVVMWLIMTLIIPSAPLRHLETTTKT